jgi:hypothetical protein
MRRTSVALRAAAIALLAATLAPSAEAQGRFRGMARLGAEMGGDQVVQVQYADGSTPDVTAGGGLVVSGGLAMRLLPSVDAQLNAGWKYRTIPKASNQEASWSRFPVEGMLFVRTPIGLRLGGGATVHLANALKTSGDVLNSRVEFENTPGYLFQTEYVFASNISVDVRYTLMKYKVVGDESSTVQANSVGAGFSVLFGR